MKNIASLFLALLFAVSTFAQTKSPVTGQWKVVSVEDDGISMDFVTDSFSIIEELQSDYPTDAAVKQKKAGMKKEFGQLQFAFATDNTFKILDVAKTKVLGTYQLDAAKKTALRITYRDASHQQVVEECTFFDVSPYLLFSMKKGTLKFTLQRIR